MGEQTNQISAILADDESGAREVLENLIRRFCPEVNLLGKYENLEQSVEAIKALKPDVVFLDIEMPRYAGYEIVDFFDEIEFEIIFVSAYDHYAIRAFEVSAVDYLLKPIDVDRLQESIKRVAARHTDRMNAQRYNMLRTTIQEQEVNSIMIFEKGYQYAVDLSQVVAFEAQESYCYVHTGERKYVVSKNLKHFETILDQHQDFFRVHKSWLINMKHFVSYSKSQLDIQLSGGLVAKLSKLRKSDFEAYVLKMG